MGVKVNKRTKWGGNKNFSLIISLLIFSFFYGNFSGRLFAYGEPIPISGTPKISQQYHEWIKEYDQKKSISKELNSRQIFADVLNQPQVFWAFNFNFPPDNLNGYYPTAATCRDVYPLNNGCYLYIYVEDNLTLSAATITNIRNEFISNIFPKLSEYFGTPPAKDFTIFILDIKDDYNPATGNTTYVSGYFDFRNEYDYLPYSNKRSMIYLDANPGVPGSLTSFGTLAHEFQHFIHFNKDPLEETWVNEGLSGLARYVCGYGHRKSHIEAFANNPNTSLTIWNDSLANYGATYLFMLYLANHYGGPTITRNIVANSERGITGINNALGQSGYAISFNNVFRNWVIANYLNNSAIYDGIYGYNDNFDGISPAPGKIKVYKTHTSYPAIGSGSINQYAAEYINFHFLGGIYDIFVLIAHSSSGGSFAYSGYLGSLLLHIEGINDQMRMSGIQEGTTSVAPIVLPDLTAESRISPFGGLAWDSSERGGGCFIATAIYGSPISKEVTILREFRDRFLLTNDWGKKIVAIYYRHSPTLARFISPREELRLIARLLIYPLIGFSYALLRYPLSVAISIIFLSGFLFRKFCPRQKKKAIILPDERRKLFPNSGSN